MDTDKSFFDGKLRQWFGWAIMGVLVTVFTLGLCYPWAFCVMYRWETKHTVLGGRRLVFTGSAIGLFGLWIKWFLLGIITIGIYFFWVGINLKEWKYKYTSFSE